ncbi:MAG: hypothetical protein ACYS0D_14580 [Planctomycetota bacterium]
MLAISSTHSHTAALLSDGTVRTWGWNGYGQLGDGTTTDSPFPIQVVNPSDPSGFLQDVMAVRAGYGSTLAVLSDGTLRAWGGNDEGLAHASSKSMQKYFSTQGYRSRSIFSSWCNPETTTKRGCA